MPNDVALARAAVDRLFHDLEHDGAFTEARRALQASPGKMLGVALVETPDGRQEMLRAFSGELGGLRDWAGWVPPVLRRKDTADLEAATLARIGETERAMKSCDVAGAQQRLRDALAERKATTRQQRSAEVAERVVRARQALVAERTRLQELRDARRQASRALSTALFDTTALTNARGERRPLREIFVGSGIAGGTADCAIPKLLEAANTARLRPIALAEAWWGSTLNGRTHGSVHGPCERKCRPILGHLLCGLETRTR